MTAIRWCGDEVSTVTSVTVENPLEAPGADGKAYPSERLNAARRQLSRDELKDLVIRLRKEHRLSYRQIEEATGVPDNTAMRWCEEELSTAPVGAVENHTKVQSADGKERPSERLSPVDLAERRRRVRELRNAGYTLEEIAEELGVSLGTAELYPGRGVKKVSTSLVNRPDPPAAQNFDFRGPPIFWGNDFHHRRSRGGS